MRKVWIFPTAMTLRVLTILAGALAVVSAAAQSPDEMADRLLLASPETIRADQQLTAYMNDLAETAIENHCAACHGENLRGRQGVPDLVDYEWIWGINGFEMTSVEPVMEIMQTILYGVRNTDCPDEIKLYGGCPDTRYSEMPAYSELGYDDRQIDAYTDYVLALGSGTNAALPDDVSWAPCSECHGENGGGNTMFGGPDLTDDVWLFGNDRGIVRDVIANGRTETCPAWSDRLEPETIKALAVYLYNRSYGY